MSENAREGLRTTLRWAGAALVDEMELVVGPPGPQGEPGADAPDQTTAINALNDRVAALEAWAAESPPPPPTPPIIIPPPTPTGFGDEYDRFSLAINPDFDPAAPTLKDGTLLTGDELTYREASVHAFWNNNETSGDAKYSNIVSRLGRNDSFTASRNGKLCLDPLFADLRLTGDARNLDRAIDGFNALWGNLIIEWSGSSWSPKYDVASGSPWSPYRKLLFLYDDPTHSLYGTDIRRLEVVKLTTMMAEMAVACHVNRAQVSPAGHDYAMQADRWAGEIENFIKAWSGGSSDDGTWRGNYAAVDGWSADYGFEPFLGRYTERAPAGFYPMFARNGGHTAYDSTLLHYHLYRLGEAGYDIPNHAAALDAADMMMERIHDAGHVPCDTVLGPGLLPRGGSWFSGGPNSRGSIAQRTGYTAATAGSYISTWLIGRWRNVLTRDVMNRIARTYSISTVDDGQMYSNLGFGSTGSGLDQESTEPTRSVWSQASTGRAHMCIFEGPGESHLEEVSQVVQAGSIAGGLVAPTYGILAQGLFLKSALRSVGDIE